MDSERRDRIKAYLVGTEGVSASEASDFLDVVNAAEDEDPEMHAGLVNEIELRMAASAASLLSRVAATRETRASGTDVSRLLTKTRKIVG